MTKENDDKVQGLTAIVNAQGLLLEVAFSLICQLHPDGGTVAANQIASQIRDIVRRRPPVDMPTDVEDEVISQYVEAYLLEFCERFEARIPPS